MGRQLFDAHRQWATRPADERFETLDEMYSHAVDRRARALDFIQNSALLKVEAVGEDIRVIPNEGFPVTPTHWGFQQLSTVAKAPAAFLRQLPAKIVADTLNHQLPKVQWQSVKLMTLADPEGERPLLQAVNGPGYGRIWSADYIAAIKILKDKKNLINPPDWSGRPSGLFDGDRSMFAFLIDGGSIVNAGRDARGRDDVLHQGAFFWNSEVGDCKIGYSHFMLEKVCGNLIVWGASEVKSIEFKHSMYAPERFASELYPAIQAITTASPKPAEQAISKAQQFMLPADTKEFTAWGLKQGFSKGELKEGVAAAQQQAGDCRTLWHLVQGLTAYAQKFAWADAQVDLSTRAGSLLDLVA